MSGPRHSLTTPEGLELGFTTATASERLVALTIDLGILLAAVLLTVLVVGPTLGPGPVYVIAFLLRVFYFAWSEARSNGRTFGKRRMHLRVIRADGGPLSTEVVLARNFSREIELFLPLQIILTPDAYHGDHAGPLTLLASVWVVLLLLFPLTNRQRLRIGDLLAGTRVVVEPSAALLRDLAAGPRGERSRQAEPEPQFLDAQLAVYGIKELDVLEDVLRKARAPGGEETLAAVAASIRKRIGWTATGPAPADYTFLRAFYAAQRRHLEHRLLLGQRREHKRS
jgi:uncharacterized RDD family membrane protein YckC